MGLDDGLFSGDKGGLGDDGHLWGSVSCRFTLNSCQCIFTCSDNYPACLDKTSTCPDNSSACPDNSSACSDNSSACSDTLPACSDNSSACPDNSSACSDSTSNPITTCTNNIFQCASPKLAPIQTKNVQNHPLILHAFNHPLFFRCDLGAQICVNKHVNLAIHHRLDVSGLHIRAVVFYHGIWMEHI